jgi:hypothetical protein
MVSVVDAGVNDSESRRHDNRNVKIVVPDQYAYHDRSWTAVVRSTQLDFSSVTICGPEFSPDRLKLGVVA